MSTAIYTEQLRAATAELGFKLVKPPPSLPVADVAAAREHLLTLAHSQPQEKIIEATVKPILEEAWPVAELRELIQRLGVNPQGRSRADLGRQFVSLFLDPGRLALVFEQLDRETQEFYGLLLLNLEFNTVEPILNSIKVLKPFSQAPEYYLQRIAAAGLVLWQDQDYLRIPPSLQRFLPRIYLPAEIFAAPLPPKHQETPRHAYTVAQVQQFLALLTAHRVTRRPVRQWGGPEVRQRSVLSEPVPTPEATRTLTRLSTNESLWVELLAPEPLLDENAFSYLCQKLAMSPTTLEGLYHLLVAAGIVRPGSPVQVEPEILETFLTLEPGEQLTALARAFLYVDNWAPFWPLWRTGQVRVQALYRSYWGLSQSSQLLAQVLARLNHMCLRYLAMLPHDLWLDVQTVLAMLLALMPEPGSVIPSKTLQLSDVEGTWQGFLNAYMETLLTGPLHWLGLADIGRDRHGDFSAFRLQHLQDIVWGREKVSLLPTIPWHDEHAWQWQHETLLVRPPIPRAVMQMLQQWAEPAGVEQEMLCYRPDVQRLYAAFEAGESLATLQRAWVESVGSEPPAALSAWWQHWWERYGHVRLYPQQAILSTADELTMKEIQVAVPELREGVLGLINPRMALLRSEHLESLLKQLTLRGYMPKDLSTSEADASLPVLEGKQD